MTAPPQLRPQPPPHREPSPPALAWTSWPVRDDWPRSLVLVAIVLGLAVAVGWSFASAGWGAFAALVLLGALGRYFVPATYRLDAQGLTVRTLGQKRHRRWSEIRAYYPHHDGVFLSPFARPSPLDPFRGLYLRYRSPADRAAVERFLEAVGVRRGGASGAAPGGAGAPPAGACSGAAGAGGGA
ncbi:MAG: hypothetical protein KatS3mg102_2791 [Planctomycetota bacterium]|nr:MAG: hypothetical protein KatS3mg102_2791 [Planctomycetota bacterium]